MATIAGCNAVQVQQDCAYLETTSIISIESLLTVARDGGAPYEDAIGYASEACATAADPAQCRKCWLAMVDYVYGQ